MPELAIEDWMPMSPLIGPPLPRWMQVTWPWYKEEGPPPEGYTCPYCGDKFATYDEVISHIQTEHPGERIPIDIIWE
ncbi:hypothetical protein ES703_123202 [subsurface metagenome]